MKAPPQASRYLSVSIVRASRCCAAVKAMVGQRFLATEAPALPLPTCSLSNECRCRFQKHPDRRDDYRRLPGETSRWYPGPEKRGTRGRRGSD